MSSSELLPPPPSVWGLHGWRFLHYVSLGYPNNPTEEQKENYKNFFISIKHILPCVLCSSHYSENYDKMPLTDEILNSKELVVKWVIDIHNVVNASKNKRIVPYDEALELINTDVKCTIPESIIASKKNNMKSENNINNILPLLGILAGLIIIAVMYKRK